MGRTRQLSVSVNGQPAQPGQLSWSSANPAVVRVGSGGLLTAVSAGSASVRAALVGTPATSLDIPMTVQAGIPAPAPSAAPAPAPGDFAQQVLALTNQARSCGSTICPAAPALTWNAQLAQAV